VSAPAEPGNYKLSSSVGRRRPLSGLNPRLGKLRPAACDQNPADAALASTMRLHGLVSAGARLTGIV